MWYIAHPESTLKLKEGVMVVKSPIINSQKDDYLIYVWINIKYNSTSFDFLFSATTCFIIDTFFPLCVRDKKINLFNDMEENRVDYTYLQSNTNQNPLTSLLVASLLLFA